ncbi:hypothetical protein HF086_015463 [Spodoptera exigua]|uniref:Uncharacterized protein n=1 Tax=Spodoptera exigua TaxID=7107 RepID=A0A922SP39_SPOEX|nr:hypothetical protein HF086_015463 [Spodoptera exigua]
MLCCNVTTNSTFKLSMTDELRDCFEQSKDPVTCEREICIAKKKGFATKDNQIDMKKLEELINDEFFEYTNLLEDVKMNCLNENFEIYAPSEFCNFTKMRYCIAVQILSHCLEWHDNADCKEMKGFVEKCVKMSQ